MSSRGGRRHLKQRAQRGRPSVFFLVAISTGLLLFLWILVQVLTRPQKDENPRKQTAADYRVAAIAMPFSSRIG